MYTWCTLRWLCFVSLYLQGSCSGQWVYIPAQIDCTFRSTIYHNTECFLQGPFGRQGFTSMAHLTQLFPLCQLEVACKCIKHLAFLCTQYPSPFQQSCYKTMSVGVLSLARLQQQSQGKATHTNTCLKLTITKPTAHHFLGSRLKRQDGTAFVTTKFWRPVAFPTCMMQLEFHLEPCSCGLRHSCRRFSQ